MGRWYNDITMSSGQRGGGYRISSNATSSLGDRKKGYPKQQALWELTLALSRFPIACVCFLLFFLVDLNGFCCDSEMLGGHFNILGILGIWGGGHVQCAFSTCLLTFVLLGSFAG